MLHTFAVYVEDKPGVLNRIASLFRRRAFNIDSLTVGHTETEGVSRMTIVCDADETSARRIEANVYKLVNVLRVPNAMLIPDEGDALIKVTDGKSIYVIHSEAVHWVRIDLAGKVGR